MPNTNSFEIVKELAKHLLWFCLILLMVALCVAIILCVVHASSNGRSDGFVAYLLSSVVPTYVCSRFICKDNLKYSIIRTFSQILLMFGLVVVSYWLRTTAFMFLSPIISWIIVDALFVCLVYKVDK